MNSRIILFIYCICLVFLSCQDNDQSDKVAKTTATNTVHSNADTAKALAMRTGLTTAPALLGTDSLQIIYYDNPDGDSLRYARFFRYLPTHDTAVINGLKAALDQTVQPANAPRACRSEGKIYAIGKENVLKTIFFSTRCDSCCYLYYIHDGEFLYFNLPSTFRETLLANRKYSRKP